VREKLIPSIAGLFIILVTLWAAVTDNPSMHSVLTRFDNLLYDLQLKPLLYKPSSIEVPIRIVDLDEKKSARRGSVAMTNK